MAYLESLPKERADSVCRRARVYGLWRLSELKNLSELTNIVTRRLDIADLPDGVDAPAPQLDGSPRFARAIGELYLRHAEVNHGWQ